jgi:protein gp37
MEAVHGGGMSKQVYGVADKAWQPIIGCNEALPCAANCWAKRSIRRIIGCQRKKHPERASFFQQALSHDGRRWAGQVFLDEKHLVDPLHWHSPQIIATAYHGDLFLATWQRIKAVFDVMQQCPQHQFLTLTKRPEDQRQFLEWWAFHHDGPLPNHWPGISIMDQPGADRDIPIILQSPAAHRWVSLEPMLGPVDLDEVPVVASPGFFGGALRWHHRGRCHEVEGVPYPILDWVVLGGESGPGARPMQPDWVRSVVQQCQSAGVPVYVKQILERGKKLPIDQWPEDLRVREFPRIP